MSGRRAAPRTARRRPFLVALVATVGSLVGIAAVIAVVASVFVGGLARTFDDDTRTIPDAFPETDRPEPSTGAENILLIGSDQRNDAATDRSGQPTSGRSDTLMLVHVPADRSAWYLMSILRDSWVDVPGHGTAKINAAYSWGGVPLTVQTVEELVDVRIDHVAEIDFQGFGDMSTALGGVEVRAPKAFTQNGHDFVAGANRVEGDAALAFVRARYPFADGDHQRVRNQQSFMRGVAEDLMSKDTITNPARIQDFVSATSRYLSVDAGLDFRTLVGLGWSMRQLRPNDLHTFSLPTAGGGTSADGQSYVELDEPALRSLSGALRTDEVGRWLAHH